MVWKVEQRPYKMWNDDLGLNLVIAYQRFGNLFDIQKGDQSFVKFFAYSSLPDGVDEGDLSGIEGKVPLIWNVVADEGVLDKNSRRQIITDFFDSYQAFWGDGLGKAGNKRPVAVQVIFDCPTPY